ncbi:MAG: ATP-binding cassette domain-containing protein [Saprospirales bacterium]|nr:ATP-binding cassette domain-containing protein [Saprospirales bacterium]MBK8489897.1 ATP-binding cassette domain-containing protein [Saprospirales bacterium]
MHDILRLEGVVKSYDKKVAVDNVTFSVPKGSIFGLLGPNGAGKTSLIRIITTITRADSGKVFLDGAPLGHEHPSQIGYMPEERGLYKKMKVGDHLLYLARLKGLSKKDATEQITRWMDKFEISDWWGKKVEELSKGMQQKIQFIATVVHRPQLLILDEPFSGLDPINTNLIKEEIKELRRNGASIIFSTHRMEQVEEICEDIVLINQGRNVLEGDVHQIRTDFKENLFRIAYQGNLPDLPDSIQVVDQEEGRFVARMEKSGASDQLLLFLLQKGVHITEFQEILPSLNQIFIRQVGLTNAPITQSIAEA